MKYKINRNAWRNGVGGCNSKGVGETALLNDFGYMCCLGQICLQKEIRPEAIYNKSSPLAIQHQFDEKDELLYKDSKYFNNSDLSKMAMLINDNEESTSDEKEQYLIKLFADNNIELEFYDGPIPKSLVITDKGIEWESPLT